LSLDEITTGTGSQNVVVRSAIAATSGGKLVISLNDVQGLRAWLDAKPIAMGSNLALNITTGRHTLDLWIDRSVRKMSVLRCEIIDAKSSAIAQWSAAQP
jgi:hypothetical protein